MKKEYVKPMAEQISFQADEMIASGNEVSVGTGDNDEITRP